MIPLAIGMAVTVMHLIGIPIDGCSINPTRSFASAAVSQYHLVTITYHPE
jgi:glycerol uptake facilitator-like aquaporin